MYANCTLLGRNHLARGRVATLLADHAAHGFAAFPAIDRGFVVAVNLRRGASARRNGVVHFVRIEGPTHADNHATDLQYDANDCQSPTTSKLHVRTPHSPSGKQIYLGDYRGGVHGFRGRRPVWLAAIIAKLARITELRRKSSGCRAS